MSHKQPPLSRKFISFNGILQPFNKDGSFNGSGGGFMILEALNETAMETDGGFPTDGERSRKFSTMSKYKIRSFFPEKVKGGFCRRKRANEEGLNQMTKEVW